MANGPPAADPAGIPARAGPARFDELVREAARSGPPVITHGEPHPGNILRAAGKLRLIDWVIAGPARPERDLWSVADADSRERERYAELTGRRADPAAMRMYRMRWSLNEITLSLSDFRGRHEQNEDTELAWAVLTEETENILQLCGNRRPQPKHLLQSGWQH
jgi:spectinomycin phosphotransferase